MRTPLCFLAAVGLPLSMLVLGNPFLPVRTGPGPADASDGPPAAGVESAEPPVAPATDGLQRHAMPESVLDALRHEFGTGIVELVAEVLPQAGEWRIRLHDGRILHRTVATVAVVADGCPAPQAGGQ